MNEEFLKDCIADNELHIPLNEYPKEGIQVTSVQTQDGTDELFVLWAREDGCNEEFDAESYVVRLQRILLSNGFSDVACENVVADNKKFIAPDIRKEITEFSNMEK